MRFTFLSRNRHAYTMFLALVVLLSGSAYATNVREVGLAEAVMESELVFEGVAISTHSNISPDTGQPFTYFTFQILEVIKGTYSQPTITLGYLGGTKNGYVLNVADMILPKIGERGIYFVESLSRQQVHPLYGWQQWHLLIFLDKNDGMEKVMPVDPPKAGLTVARLLRQIKMEIRSLALQQPR